MTTIHGNVKCDCGHKQKDHYQNNGYCHSFTHVEPGKCGCTWFHPNRRYVHRKNIQRAKKRQLKLF